MFAWHVGHLRKMWVRVQGDANMMASPMDATDVVWVSNDVCSIRWF